MMSRCHMKPWTKFFLPGGTRNLLVAERFSYEYGVVRLSVGETMRKILSSQPHTELARQINLHVRSGNTVPDKLAVQALEIALMDTQCQTRGYVLDGYPLTRNQIELMTQRKIIPVKILELRVEEEEVLRRGTVDRHAPSRILPLHDSHQILAIRLACWQREVGEVREWYLKEHRNWVSIDGQRSKWWVWHEALNEASKGVRQIQTYLQRLSEGKAASIADMCVRPDEFKVRLGDFGQYCPVSLAEKGELVDCSVEPSLDFAAEFRGRYYKMASRSELEMFLTDPAHYVPPHAPRKLPPPELLPRRRTAVEVKAMFPIQIELQGYCPITYLDGKLRYESIVPGDQELVVEYKGKLYFMESEEKLQTFMRLPEKYSNLVLPHKLPPKKDPLPVSGLPMLGYMEQTIATAITKALTAVGCFKPKYPFLDAKRSALLYVAYHLKAHNPNSSDYIRKKYRQKLLRFEDECELIKYLGSKMTICYVEPNERPIDFDYKMTNFLSLKGLEPTMTWRA